MQITMAKQNFFLKNLKRHFLSFNESIENYFDKLRFFVLNLKKTKLNTKYKVFGGLGVIFVLFLLYMSIPNLYNKSQIQSQIKDQILKKYNIQIKLNEAIQYSFFPKPHFFVKNLTILRKDKEIGLSRDFKVFISFNNFLNFNSVNIKDLVFNMTDFKIYEKDIIFFFDLLNTEPNENKITIKNSNIFFNSKEDEVLFINRIYQSKFYYDQNKLMNILSAKNKIFNIPFDIEIKNDKFNKKIFSEFKSKKFRLSVTNLFEYDYKNNSGFMDVLLINKSTSFNYKIKKNSLSFISDIRNNSYDGTIDFKPFYFNANFNYDGLSSKNLFNNDSIIFQMIKSELFNNDNLNILLNINVKNIVNINELNNLFLKVAIEEGEIRLSNSSIKWKDDLDIILNECLIDYENDEVKLIGDVKFKFKDIDNFYSSYQVKKDHRKKIQEIQLDFVYNFIQKKISFDNVKIDNMSNEKIDEFINQFDQRGTKVFNKITFKNFLNNFFGIYAG
ncbi:MAG: hypothetical protein CNA95_00650 [Pelagibacterales bacterium MED-G41]|nr:MAG: hypothetical protein CNA95_00650 [Pelagibacterales bacterium MED-G41]